MINTFYSYKGGVGRSMAMANVADLLARRGLKVLMIDFDLEAPGLEKFFQIDQESVRRHAGLLDLLLAYKRSMSVARGEDPTFRNLANFICPVYEKLPGGGRLDILPAGRRQGAEQLARYALELRTFDWQDFYFNWEGELFFEWLRRSLGDDRASGTGAGYDAVLVDSRTGVTEMGGICGYQLADTIVMLCAANHQNVEGTQNMVRDFRSPSVESLRRGRPLQIVVVPARIEQRDAQLLEAFFARFDAAFAGLAPAELSANGIAFRDLMIPYEPQYAFEERVVSDPALAAERKRIGGAFERLADVIALLAPPTTALGGATHVRRPPGAGVQPPADAAPVEAQYNVAKRFAGYDVFLDASGDDRELTEPIWRALQEQRLQVFYDRAEIAPGGDWEAVVENAMFHSRALLYCIGGGGLSDWRRRTLDIALRAQDRGQGLRIVPVMLPGADYAVLRETPLARIQALDARDGVGPALLHQLLRLVEDQPRGPTVQTEARNPFVGQRAFGEEHGDLFFGREGVVEALQQRVEQQPFVLLTGPSGAGKTSLVMAGLVPRLRQAASGPWSLVAFRPGERPLERLAEALAQTAEQRAAGTPVLLFVNKLEEIYTLCPDAAQREAFMARLAALPGELRESACVLAVLREDFIDRVASSAALARLVREQRFELMPMSMDELRQAIERPAERVGLAFEPGLVERIVSEMQSEPNALSLLQQLLARLWAERREGWLTNGAYDAIGGLRGVLAMRAEEVYAALDPTAQSTMRALLLRLVQISRGGEETRRRMPLEAIRPAAAQHDPDLAAAHQRALDALLDARLLIAAEEQGQRAVEPAHESLIRGWERLRGWLDDEREALRRLQTLDAARGAWVRSGRKPDALLRGAALADALRLQQRSSLELTAGHVEFIRASQKARSSRRLTLVYGSLIVLVVAAAAIYNYRKAQDEQARAQVEQARAQVERAAALRAEGDALAGQGANNMALARYTEAIKLDPGNAAARFRRGLVFLRDGKAALAAHDFSRAIELGGEPAALAEYHLNRGRALAAQDKLQDALQDYGAAAALDPANSTTWLELGRVHDKLAAASADASDKSIHTTAAINAYSRAIELDAQFAEAYFNRGAAFERGRERKRAIADFVRVLALPSAGPELKEAARARLDQLGATAARPAPAQRRVRVVLHYADPRDASAIEPLVRALRTADFVLDAPEQRDDQTGGQVRFFFPQDENAAGEVRTTVQSQLARAGTPLRLALQFRDAKEFPGVRPGTIEVWLPSLSAPVGVSSREQAVKRY